MRGAGGAPASPRARAPYTSTYRNRPWRVQPPAHRPVALVLRAKGEGRGGRGRAGQSAKARARERERAGEQRRRAAAVAAREAGFDRRVRG